MARYRVRNIQALRACMASSQRVVPHSIRSLATLVGTNRTTIGYLLTGERPVVDEALAQRIAVAFASPMEDLFVPESSPSINDEGAK